jgi:type IV secretory pathway VirB3-like protein
MFNIFLIEILTATLWLSVILVFFYFVNKITSKKDLTTRLWEQEQWKKGIENEKRNKKNG